MSAPLSTASAGLDVGLRALMPDSFQLTVFFLTALVKGASAVLLRPRRSLARG